MPSVCSPNLSLPFSPLREMGYPFSAPKLILLQRLCRQLSVTTSISSPTSKRELSPNGLISCGQSGVERGRCNPVRKTTKILYASVAPPSLHLFPLPHCLSGCVSQSGVHRCSLHRLVNHIVSEPQPISVQSGEPAQKITLFTFLGQNPQMVGNTKYTNHRRERCLPVVFSDHCGMR